MRRVGAPRRGIARPNGRGDMRRSSWRLPCDLSAYGTDSRLFDRSPSIGEYLRVPRRAVDQRAFSRAAAIAARSPPVPTASSSGKRIQRFLGPPRERTCSEPTGTHRLISLRILSVRWCDGAGMMDQIGGAVDLKMRSPLCLSAPPTRPHLPTMSALRFAERARHGELCRARSRSVPRVQPVPVGNLGASP